LPPEGPEGPEVGAISSDAEEDDDEEDEDVAGDEDEDGEEDAVERPLLLLRELSLEATSLSLSIARCGPSPRIGVLRDALGMITDDSKGSIMSGPSSGNHSSADHRSVLRPQYVSQPQLKLSKVRPCCSYSPSKPANAPTPPHVTLLQNCSAK